MPYSGPSKGCNRCRQRHIKCDEDKPGCRNCARSRVDCPGYRFKDGLLFEDETNRTVQRVETIERRRSLAAANAPHSQSSTSRTKHIAPSYEDAALTFFLRNFTIIAPDSASRAWFDLVKEQYPALSAESPAALAAATLALELFSMWAPSETAEEAITRSLGKALKAVNKAVNVHETAMHDDTLMAVLMLQYYTNVSRYKRLSEGSGDHQAGARALVQLRGRLNFQTRESTRLLQTVRNHLVSSAVRAGVRLDLDPTIWRNDLEEHRPLPAELDWLGLEVASLKADFAEMEEFEALSDNTMAKYNLLALENVLATATAVDQHLKAWQNSLPTEWYPVRVEVRRSTTPPYQSADPETEECDAYSSIQTADTWNQYRVYRLTCLEIIWYCRTVQDRETIMSLSSSAEQATFSVSDDFSTISDQIQELVDQICDSIPYHLGDRIERQHIDEFSRLENASWPLPPQRADSSSTTDTLRALIATGAWYILGPLSFLVQRFSPQLDSNVDLPVLREGQLDWINGQILRVMQMHGFAQSLNTLGDNHIQGLRSSLRYTPGV